VRLLAIAAMLLPWGCRALLPYSTESGSLSHHDVVAHYVFGRKVRVQFFDSNGVEVWRVIGTYEDSLDGCMPATDCAAIHPAALYDDDADGRWDRWSRRIQKGESCFIEYRVDTDHDGAADWQFVARWGDYEETAAAIKARRGY
jgi:hypothetical protein